MKINWKNRLKNGTTLTAIIGALLLFVKQITEIFGIDISHQLEQVSGIIGTIITLLVGMGVVTNPNTKGVSDAGIDLDLNAPRNEETHPVQFKEKETELPQYEETEGVKHYTDLDEDEAPFKNESKPYGVDWNEEVNHENVEVSNNEN